jgi:hypothetical protein
LGIAPVLRAAEAWKKKPSDWSEKEVQEVLTRSPWAKEATVEFNMSGMEGGPPGGGGPGVGGGPPGGGMGGPGGGPPGMGGGPGMGGPPGGGMGGPPEFHALVRWESALPIRLAKQIKSAPSPDQYMLSVSGLPTMSRRPSSGQEAGAGEAQLSEMIARISQATRLSPKGKAAMTPTSVINREGDGPPMLTFTFDGESHPIEAKDKEVVFTTAIGPLKVRAKFVMKDMIYEGKLEV